MEPTTKRLIDELNKALEHSGMSVICNALRLHALVESDARASREDVDSKIMDVVLAVLRNMLMVAVDDPTFCDADRAKLTKSVDGAVCLITAIFTHDE